MIKQINVIKRDHISPYFVVKIGKGSSAKDMEIEVTEDEVDIKDTNSIPKKWNGMRFPQSKGETWVYKDKIFDVLEASVSEDEIRLKIKHLVLKADKNMQKIAREVEAFENFDETQKAKRERIPDDVRLFVWQRDGGKCVQCGKKERLEFDHIIPVVEGGANTERNIQLLCESCNRSKGKNI